MLNIPPPDNLIILASFDVNAVRGENSMMLVVAGVIIGFAGVGQRRKGPQVAEF